MSDLHPIVLKLAMKMKLIEREQQLLPLDSLTMIDFVIGLEECTGRSIPAMLLHPERFETIDSVVALLLEVEED